MRKIVAGMIASLLTCAWTGSALTLADRGKTEYRIFIAENASAAEQNAAGILSRYLNRSTAADFPVATVGKAASGPGIYLGESARTLPGGLDRKNGVEEEYRIENSGQNIVITGGSPRGVLYGVFAFLEKYVACRWYSMNMEVVPRRETLVLPDRLRDDVTPAFRYRQIVTRLDHYPVEEFLFYAAANRQNTWGNRPEYGFSLRVGSPGGVHTYCDYTKDFPLEISWMDSSGQRYQVKTKHNGQICYTNPEVRRRFCEKLREYIKKDREKAALAHTAYPCYYDISVNDCPALCHCPQCKAFAQKHGVSGLVLDFTNAVADSIAKDYPDLAITMLAYLDAEPPPRDIKARDNVIVRLAFMDGEYGFSRDVLSPVDAPRNTAYRNALTGWHRAARHIGIWDYWRLFVTPYPFPYTNLAALPGNIRRYRDAGADFLFAEAEIDDKGIFSFADLQAYLGARLLVDPELDAAGVVDDFMNGFYGSGAKPMKAYLAYLMARMKNEKKPLGKTVPWDIYLDAAFFTTVNQLLDEAEQLTQKEKLPLENVRQERLIVDLAYFNLKSRFPSPPLKISDRELQKRIADNWEIWGKKYFTRDYWAKNAAVIQNSFLLSPEPLPEPFKHRKVVDFTCKNMHSGNVKDSDALGGKADAVPSQSHRGHAVEFGVYDYAQKKHLLTQALKPAEIPQDEKYHLYYLGRTAITTETKFYAHWSWSYQRPLKRAYRPDAPWTKYDVYASIKLQGPSFVRGSTRKDDFRVDRIILAQAQ